MRSCRLPVKRAGIAFGIGAVLAASHAAPVDNPIATYYGPEKGYPVWTDEIDWSRTIDMSDFTDGADDFERFENARDQLYAQGGGVLYYPAGEYHFTVKTGPGGRGVMLKKGVVIRGEAPAADRAAVTSDKSRSGLGALGTKFHFAFRDMGDGEVPYMWNCFGLAPTATEALHEVSHVGVAWVDVEGAFVYMGADMAWDRTWDEFNDSKPGIGEWASRVPDGTHPMDAVAGVNNNSPYGSEFAAYVGGGTKRFVFGCRFDNATVTNWAVDDHSKGMIDEQSFYYGGYRYASRLAVFGSHVFVANNVLAKPTKCFYYTQKTIDRKQESEPSVNTVLFDYGKCGGVMVNKDLVRGLDSRCDLDGGAYYEEDVIVRDNWVYNHGNEGFTLGGKWLVVRDNVNYRDYLDESGECYNLPGTYELTLSGYYESVPIDDNQSRAFDLAGHNAWFEGNWYTGTGSHPGNDGEGMLCQRIGAVEVFSWAFTHNSQGSTGEDGYIAPYDVHVLGLLTAWNDQRGGVGIYKVVDNRAEDIAVVDNGSSNVAGADGANVRDFLATCPSHSPAAPGAVSVEEHDGVYEITWRDEANSEIGFRVDRKVDEHAWYTIAYRPRNESGAEWTYPGTEFNGTAVPGCQNQGIIDFNQQKWVDYTAPAGATTIRYRVAAIDCNDDESGVTVAEPIAVAAPPRPSRAAARIFALVRGPEGLRVRTPLDAGFTLTVHDPRGRLMSVPARPVAGALVTDLRSLAPGTYVLRLSGGKRGARVKTVAVGR